MTHTGFFPFLRSRLRVFVANWGPQATVPVQAITVFLLSFNLFVLKIEYPFQHFFDEGNYVSAAKQLLQHGIDENWSHPPLGKAIIASGIQLLGDNPLGWRIMSSVFGAATVMLMFLWGLALFEDSLIALEIALLSILNQVLFLHSRLAILDIFMVTFMIGGFYFFTRAWLASSRDSSKAQPFFFAAMVSFALATACKWFGLVPTILCAFLFFRKTRKEKRPEKKMVFFVFLALALPYCLAFLPMIGMRHSSPGSRGEKVFRLRDFIPHQIEMFKAQLKFENSPQAFYTPVLSWPLDVYPLWMASQEPTPEDPRGTTHAVVWLGNPLVFWVGFLCAWFCLFHYWRSKNRVAMLISSIYFTLWLSWLLVPRRMTLTYYYFPAAMILSLAIPYAMKTLKVPAFARWIFILACAVVAFQFYPWLVGDPISNERFQSMLWLPTWKNAPDPIAGHLPFK